METRVGSWTYRYRWEDYPGITASQTIGSDIRPRDEMGTPCAAGREEGDDDHHWDGWTETSPTRSDETTLPSMCDLEARIIQILSGRGNEDMNLDQIQAMERIDPRPLEPWRQPVFDNIDIEDDREKAIQKVHILMKAPETVIYTDASAKQSVLGAAAV